MGLDHCSQVLGFPIRRFALRLHLFPYFSPPCFCHPNPPRLGHMDQKKKDGKNMGAKRSERSTPVEDCLIACVGTSTAKNSRSFFPFPLISLIACKMGTPARLRFQPPQYRRARVPVLPPNSRLFFAFPLISLAKRIGVGRSKKYPNGVTSSSPRVAAQRLPWVRHPT